MTEEEVIELVAGERKFLHDLSNHIVVASGMLSFAQKVLKENSSVDAKEIERLNKSILAIAKMTELLKARREVLHSLS